MENQEKLMHLVSEVVRNYSQSEKLRGITAYWREKDCTVCLTFYFDGPFTDEDLEDAYDIGAGVISNFSSGQLEEKYIRFDYPKSLPNKFLAYLREKK